MVESKQNDLSSQRAPVRRAEPGFCKTNFERVLRTYHQVSERASPRAQRKTSVLVFPLYYVHEPKLETVENDVHEPKLETVENDMQLYSHNTRAQARYWYK